MHILIASGRTNRASRQSTDADPAVTLTRAQPHRRFQLQLAGTFLGGLGSLGALSVHGAHTLQVPCSPSDTLLARV